MDVYYLYVQLLFICLLGAANRWVGVFFSLLGGALIAVITRWGVDMQRWAERKLNIAAKPGF